MKKLVQALVPSAIYPPSEYVKITESGEPETFNDTMTHMNKKQWLKAMQDEVKSLHENHIYKLVVLTKGRRALKNKWVYKISTRRTVHKHDTRRG